MTLRPFGALLAVALLLASPAAAQAFGIAEFRMQASAEGGAPETLAGSHPYELTAKIASRPRRLGGPTPTATCATCASNCRRA